MLKFYSWVTGTDYNLLMTCDIKSKNKVRMYGLGLFLPVMIWFVVGNLLATEFFEKSPFEAFLIGVGMSFAIFIIERMMIMYDGKGGIVMRVGIGLAIAIIGSVVLDEQLFNADIENRTEEYVRDMKQAYQEDGKSEYDSLLRVSQVKVEKAYVDWQKELADAKKEADGTGGSQSRGLGPIARMKMTSAASFEQEYRDSKSSYENFVLKKEQFLDQSAEEFASGFNPHSLISRITIMILLLTESLAFAVIWSLFTLIMLFIEFLVVIIKLTQKETLYEAKVNYQVQLNRERLEEFERRKEAFRLYQEGVEYLERGI